MTWRSPGSRVGLVALLLVLLAFCFSYWWQGNLTHEIAGLLLLLLILRHILNNVWWWDLARRRWSVERGISTILTLALALDVLVITLTSLAISRSLSLPVPGIFTLREIHWFSAWWMLALAGLHLGMNADRIGKCVHWQNLPRAVRILAGTACVVLAVQGVISGTVLGLWPRLIFRYSLSMWDFNATVLPFFGHLAAVGLLLAVIGRNLVALGRWLDQHAGRV